MKLNTNNFDTTYRDCICVSCNRDFRRLPFIIAEIVIDGEIWVNRPHIDKEFFEIKTNGNNI